MKIKRLISCLEIKQYGRIPRGYGVAYWCVDTSEAMCYVIPLNWLVRWARAFYIGISRPRRANYLERAEGKIEDRWRKVYERRAEAAEAKTEGAIEMLCRVQNAIGGDYGRSLMADTMDMQLRFNKRENRRITDAEKRWRKAGREGPP
jgi:hypothetical protein